MQSRASEGAAVVARADTTVPVVQPHARGGDERRAPEGVAVGDGARVRGSEFTCSDDYQILLNVLKAHFN